MKQQHVTIVSLVLLVFLTGCAVVEQQRLHPPAWIQGDWEFSSSPGTAIYTFAPTTVIMQMGNMSVDYGEMFRTSGTHVTEKVTGQLYSFTALIEQGDVTAETTYEFARVDANNITVTMKFNGISIGPTPLTRI
jgi:hypothetical protein